MGKSDVRKSYENTLPINQNKSKVKDLSFNQISQGTKVSICVEYSCLGNSVLFDTLDSDSTKEKKQNRKDYIVSASFEGIY